ncbi:hypothetical protein [Mucilaginibacter sp. CSA2-8R]|uniref:hypothetical protein n=1 Tax=Mucilaginibacter sp. CSA2-8R TaxID=3141542 RepID=UPI00315D6E39
MKVYYPKSENELLLFLLARCQKTLNKHDINDPIARFKLNNIDFRVLLNLYTDLFPQPIIDSYGRLPSVKRKKLVIPSHTLCIDSKLIQHHKLFNRYGMLFDKLIEGDLNETQYQEEIQSLNKSIITDIRANFEEAVLCTLKSKKTLKPHIDTLLFVCLYFYNTIWDADGLTFNSAVAVNNSISNLTFAEQPYYFRMHKQIRDISQLLFDYYSAQSTSPYEINFVVNKRPHPINDPVSNNWIIQSLIKSIKDGNSPISFDYLGYQLSCLLKEKDKLESSEFLNNLKRFSTLELPDHINEKRIAVRQFCLEIHKVFTYYLGLDIESFDGKRSKIYHNILLAFQMDDFNNYMRNSDRIENKSSRADAASNRLGALLRGENTMESKRK